MSGFVEWVLMYREERERERERVLDCGFLPQDYAGMHMLKQPQRKTRRAEAPLEL